MSGKLKRLILALLAGAMLLLAAGCGGALPFSEETALPADAASDIGDTEEAEKEKDTLETKETASGKESDRLEYGDESAVSAAWGDDALIDVTECETFTVDDGEYSTEVVFYTARTVTDFELMSLCISEVYDDGTVSYGAESLYSMGSLTPDCPLVVRMSFPGDLPAYGISYVDDYGDGMTHRLTVEISGEDGSLILREMH